MLSPGDSTAATREPDSVSYEHRSFLSQTLGMAPLTLLVSAGGVAAASTVSPFLFSGSTCCVNTVLADY